MKLPVVFESFLQKSPLPVMVRATLERAFDDYTLDTVFGCFAKVQHGRKLLYSTCVELMAEVVTRAQPSLGAAIRNHKETLPVHSDCVYKKIAKLEDDVVSATVAVTAAEMAQVVDSVGGALPSLIPGMRTLVLDANHLQAAQHRIKPLRQLPQAALPGTGVALLDADRRLFIEIFLLQDGHASEMQVLPNVAARLAPCDVLLADRNLGTREFAAAIEDRGAFFLLRQHSTRFPVQLIGERRFVGETETGLVYEQEATYEVRGITRSLRRITVELFQPTRNQDKVLHLLSNLPHETIDPVTGEMVPITAITLGNGYRQRWSIETAFQKMTVELNCELNTLGYPPAALFGFCVAAMCYNVYSAAIAALRGHFGAQRVEQEFSTYYMANDVRAVWAGMNVAVPEDRWHEAFRGLPLEEFAACLLELASRVNPARYKKAKTRPKRPPTPGASKRAKAKHTSVIKQINIHKQTASK